MPVIGVAKIQVRIAFRGFDYALTPGGVRGAAADAVRRTLADLQEHFNQALRTAKPRAFHAMGDAGVAYLRHITPQITGALDRSYRWNQTGDTVVWASSSPYFRAVSLARGIAPDMGRWVLGPGREIGIDVLRAAVQEAARTFDVRRVRIDV